MSHSLILQVLNGYLFVLSLCTIVIFLHYLVKNRREGYIFLRPAIALSCLWLGSLVLRGPLWYTRQQLNMGHQIPTPDNWITMGGFLTVAAYLCVMRVFSPEGWGHKSWVAGFTVATLFTLVSLLYTTGRI